MNYRRTRFMLAIVPEVNRTGICRYSLIKQVENPPGMVDRLVQEKVRFL